MDRAASALTESGSLKSVKGIDPAAVMNMQVGTLGVVGHFHGHMGFEEIVEDLQEAFAQVRWSVRRTAEVDPRDLLLVVFELSAVGKGGGVPLETELAVLMAMENARVTRMDAYRTEADALEAVGLSA